MAWMKFSRLGRVKVTRLPKKIPKNIKSKEAYRVIWASDHLAKGEEKRLTKKWVK